MGLKNFCACVLLTATAPVAQAQPAPTAVDAQKFLAEFLVGMSMHSMRPEWGNDNYSLEGDVVMRVDSGPCRTDFVYDTTYSGGSGKSQLVDWSKVVATKSNGKGYAMILGGTTWIFAGSAAPYPRSGVAFFAVDESAAQRAVKAFEVLRKACAKASMF